MAAAAFAYPYRRLIPPTLRWVLDDSMDLNRTHDTEHESPFAPCVCALNEAHKSFIAARQLFLIDLWLRGNLFAILSRANFPTDFIGRDAIELRSVAPPIRQSARHDTTHTGERNVDRWHVEGVGYVSAELHYSVDKSPEKHVVRSRDESAHTGRRKIFKSKKWAGSCGTRPIRSIAKRIIINHVYVFNVSVFSLICWMTEWLMLIYNNKVA